MTRKRGRETGGGKIEFAKNSRVERGIKCTSGTGTSGFRRRLLCSPAAAARDGRVRYNKPGFPELDRPRYLVRKSPRNESNFPQATKPPPPPRVGERGKKKQRRKTRVTTEVKRAVARRTASTKGGVGARERIDNPIAFPVAHRLMETLKGLQ